MPRGKTGSKAAVQRDTGRQDNVDDAGRPMTGPLAGSSRDDRCDLCGSAMTIVETAQTRDNRGDIVKYAVRECDTNPQHRKSVALSIDAPVGPGPGRPASVDEEGRS